jgi:hypothetical protein
VTVVSVIYFIIIVVVVVVVGVGVFQVLSARLAAIHRR